jgi:hypothetical protein
MFKPSTINEGILLNALEEESILERRANEQSLIFSRSVFEAERMAMEMAASGHREEAQTVLANVPAMIDRANAAEIAYRKIRAENGRRLALRSLN